MSRLETVKEYSKAYWNSDYSADKKAEGYGYLRFDGHAMKGRVISLIDAPKKVARQTYELVKMPVLLVYHITAGGAALIISIPMTWATNISACCGLRCSESLAKRTVSVISFGGKNFVFGVFDVIFYPIVVVVRVAYLVFMVTSDILGIFCPEVGRWARYDLPAAMSERVTMKFGKWSASFLPPEMVDSLPDDQRNATKAYLDLPDALEFFGLTEETAAPNVISKIYKKGSALLHPDKNGGTEAAKENFQKLGQHYGSLKLIFKNHRDVPERKVTSAVDAFVELCKTHQARGEALEFFGLTEETAAPNVITAIYNHESYRLKMESGMERELALLDQYKDALMLSFEEREDADDEDVQLRCQAFQGNYPPAAVVAHKAEEVEKQPKGLPPPTPKMADID